jgi:NAD(P)-dependent dehydrogenase (short-subunit alcohol dehydrogenase family)
MEDTSLEDFRKVTGVNIDGVFLGMKHAGPLIRERMTKWEGGGSIINMSSVAGLVGLGGAPAYCASKGAVRLMTKAAALEYAQNGEKIRVNSIHPAFTETAMAEQMLEGMVENGMGANRDEAHAFLTMMHPIGRLGKPRDIANAAVFLASDESAFMTGSEMVVDGGLAAR